MTELEMAEVMRLAEVFKQFNQMEENYSSTGDKQYLDMLTWGVDVSHNTSLELYLQEPCAKHYPITVGLIKGKLHANKVTSIMSKLISKKWF